MIVMMTMMLMIIATMIMIIKLVIIIARETILYSDSSEMHRTNFCNHFKYYHAAVFLGQVCPLQGLQGCLWSGGGDRLD
jgi:hypothetical protein